MRLYHLLISLILFVLLAACGTEDLSTPPIFSNVVANGVTTAGARTQSITISGKIDDVEAELVADSSATEPQSVSINNDGTWEFTFAPNDGDNQVILTATDLDQNINQMVLTVVYNPLGPVVAAVTQNTDPAPRIMVTFNGPVFESSLATAVFALDGVRLDDATMDSEVSSLIVTIPLSASLSAGAHQLTCGGINDISTTSNPVPVNYSYNFVITE